MGNEKAAVKNENASVRNREKSPKKQTVIVGVSYFCGTLLVIALVCWQIENRRTGTADFFVLPGWSWPLLAMLTVLLVAVLEFYRHASTFIVAVTALLASFSLLLGITQENAGGIKKNFVDAELLFETKRIASELYTFSPATAAAKQTKILDMLAGQLKLDFQTRGSNILLARAIELKASMSAKIQEAAVVSEENANAVILLFLVQKIMIPGTAEESLPATRLATMRRVAGKWRMTQLAALSTIS